MSFMTLPPEINSLRMFSGAGSAPLLEAATAWEGLASELGSAASPFGSVTSNLAGQAWPGPASQAMVAAAAPYAGWLNEAAAQATSAAGQARAVVSAFEAAQAATIQPAFVQLNRNSLVQMVMSNWFGLNAPAIAQLESEYEQMWAQDVAAMSGYHSGVSAAAAQLAPVQSLQQTLAGLPGSLTGQVNSAAAYVGLNLGLGNQGTFNLGNGNIGMYNVGSGNGSGALTSNGNVGSGNNGSNNIGSGNIGINNIGFGNTGNPSSTTPN